MGLNKPVDFSTAKLLKEKGFDEDCYRTYNHLGKISPFPLLENMGGEPILNPLDYKWRNSLIHKSVTSAPTIADVVMWLYEKHGIWIGVQPNEPYVDDDWCFTIFKDLKNNNSLEGYDSPIEAYEGAIEYVLNKYEI